MHSTEGLWGGTPDSARDGARDNAHGSSPGHTSGRAPRRRPRIGTIVVVLLLAAAITEPVIMYIKLAHQKEQRREAAELTLPVKAEVEAERAPAVP
jgi:hypothetical protein